VKSPADKQATADQARLATFRILEKIIQHKQPFEVAFNAVLQRMPHLQTRDKGFAHELSMQVLRHHGQIESVALMFLHKPLNEMPAATRLLLFMGVAQLLWMDSPPHAAIHSTVELGKHVGDAHGNTVLNAVLRRISELPEGTGEQLTPSANLPQWLLKMLAEQHGMEKTEYSTWAHQYQPPLDLTVRNIRQAAITAQQLGATVLPWGTLRMAAKTPITQLPGYQEGSWWVQDAASSLPVQLLGDISGRTAYDLCAAPGGKTMQLAAAGAKVTAVDRSAKRLKRVEQNLLRTRLEAKIVTADAKTYNPGTPADIVLLDAPCTATGTLRRNPDIALHRTQADVEKILPLQAELLDAAGRLVASGGYLLYCVCSLLQQEGEEQITAFLNRHPEFTLTKPNVELLGIPTEWQANDGSLRTFPCYMATQGSMDGFYMALLGKG
jgi:16S rRNA (cytosine967-C5)-methyltransferase